MVSKIINIVVSSPGQENIKFKLRMDTPLSKLIDKYADSVINKKPSKLDFIYDGNKISRTDTPQGLGMKEGEVVTVHETVVGGGFN